VKVRVALDQKDDRLVPDMGVRVSFLSTRPKAEARPVPGVLVPADAVVVEKGPLEKSWNVVFVVADGRAQKRSVQLGNFEGSKFKL
ncbi:hypothetical protein, partial [Proteus mirabilis]|uniref:hypothetical protein n=1 Tax=Proteus mirabilis TaxID=584 RepID=UPI001953EF18